MNNIDELLTNELYKLSANMTALTEAINGLAMDTRHPMALHAANRAKTDALVANAMDRSMRVVKKGMVTKDEVAAFQAELLTWDNPSTGIERAIEKILVARGVL